MSNRRIRGARKEVAAELARLNTAHNGLRPSAVVKAAEPESSPLHREFEWDDGKAGREYRLEQARRLIRVTILTTEGSDGQKRPDPFIHVPSTQAERKEAGNDEGVYLPMSIVVQDADSFSRALSALLSKLNAAKAAAEELRCAAESSDAPDRMAMVAMAITALQTAGAAVAAIH